MGGSGEMQMGQRTVVIYDPQDPSYVTEDSFIGVWGGSIVSLIVGTAFLAISGIHTAVRGAIWGLRHPAPRG